MHGVLCPRHQDARCAIWGHCSFKGQPTVLCLFVLQTEKQTDTQLSCKQARTTGHYLLNMPILINVVMTDPSISPKNRPAYQKRERERHHCHICTVNMEL